MQTADWQNADCQIADCNGYSPNLHLSLCLHGTSLIQTDPNGSTDPVLKLVQIGLLFTLDHSGTGLEGIQN